MKDIKIFNRFSSTKTFLFSCLKYQTFQWEQALSEREELSWNLNSEPGKSLKALKKYQTRPMWNGSTQDAMAGRGPSGHSTGFPASSPLFPLKGFSTNTQGGDHKPTSLTPCFLRWKTFKIKWSHSGLGLELMTELRLLLSIVTAVTGLSGKGGQFLIYSSQQTHASAQGLSFWWLAGLSAGLARPFSPGVTYTQIPRNILGFNYYPIYHLPPKL